MKFEEQKLKKVLADVFGLEIEDIDEESSIDTIAEWDSLKHLNLVLAIETEFGVELTDAESVEILSFALIKSILADHTVEWHC